MRRFRRIIGSAATMAAAVGLTITIGSGPAQADGFWGANNVATLRCLDDSQAFNVRTFACNQGSWESGYQKWYYHNWNDGTERLMNGATALCLRDFGNGLVAHASCDSSTWESWYNTVDADSTHRFRNQATGWCLDDSDAFNLRTFPCNGTIYQAWY